MSPILPTVFQHPLPADIGTALVRAIESTERMRSTTAAMISQSNQVIDRILSNSFSCPVQLP